MKFKISFILIFIVNIFFTCAISAEQFKVLVFTKTTGWHHESILDAVSAVRSLSEKHHFEMEWHEDASRINDDNLQQFDAIMFLSTSGDILNDDQKRAMEKFIRSGKGFIGVHSASDTEYDWEWYTQLVGRMFEIHPVIQTASLQLESRNFPGLERMPDSLLWTDEWYDLSPEKVEGLNYLLSVDERSYDTKSDWGDKKGDGMGDFHPISWYHDFDGGRSFYTALGHLPAVYKNELFLDHLYGGIYWAATGKGIK